MFRSLRLWIDPFKGRQRQIGGREADTDRKSEENANVRLWLKADSFDIERLGRKRVRFNLEILTFLRFLRGFDL